jgi:hypothetical protein
LMTDSSLQSHATAALLADEPDALRVATCPMCHTPASVTQSALAAGGDWQCVRCAQHWDSPRLAAVAAYAGWVVQLEQRRLRQRTAVEGE